MKTLLLFSFLISAIYVDAQDIYFPPSILSAGSGSLDGNSNKISKWRIGQVYILEVRDTDIKNSSKKSKSGVIGSIELREEIRVFPNPVSDNLRIHFDIEKPGFFGLTVADLSGRKLVRRKVQMVLPGETVELNLSNLSSAMYVLYVLSDEKNIAAKFKINKQ